jgi:iron(III) transport system permease protein
VALAWLQMFGPSSPLLKMLGIAPALGSRNPLYSPGGIVLVLGVQYAPLVFLTLRADCARCRRSCSKRRSRGVQSRCG